MIPTPASINSSYRAPFDASSAEVRPHVAKKRNRLPLSCHPCRSRKKCDRNQPCRNCVRRDGPDVTSCTYAVHPAQTQSQNRAPADLESTQKDMQNRITRLEDLILALMRGDSNTDGSSAGAATPVAGTATPDDKATTQGQDGNARLGGNLANSLGYLNIDPNQGNSKYISQEHWQTMLSEVSEVKAYFANHERELETGHERVSMSKPASSREGLNFLLGAVPPATEVELRAQLPPMSTVLALCSRYFNSLDNPIIIVHPPTFNQQLQRHWEDPSKTPIMWLGLLYSILCLAMLSYHKIGDEPSEWEGQTLKLAGEYRLRTVQCLVTADYTKPVENTVETMLLYVFGEFSARPDIDLGLWLVVSLATKLAFHMGYHRDAKWFPSLTPFQGEMRRRTWALLRIADVMFSHQVSLPNTIHSHQCDTHVPTNLYDGDFDPGIQTLPPSRPNNELTPTAYMIAKVQLCKEMSDILQVTNRVDGPVPYEEIMRLDTRLRKVYQELPAHLRVVPDDGRHESITVTMARFSINALYLKIICLLHRKYVPRARQNPQYAYSRRSAVTAASETLRSLITLHDESKDTSTSTSTRGSRPLEWFLKLMATKEFLVCAMLVALDLHYDCIAERSIDERIQATAQFWTVKQRAELLSNLKTIHGIWEGLAGGSTEALQASNVLDIMLQKINSPAAAVRTTQETPITSSSHPHPLKINTFPIEQPEHTSAMMLDPLAPGMMASTAAAGSAAQGFSAPLNMDFSSIPYGGLGDAGEARASGSLSGFPSLMAGSDFAEDFDWNAFETFTQGGNWGGGDMFQMFPGS